MAEKMTCTQCGMPCDAGEYHPYAACLMFTACHNSETVRANLAQPSQAVDVEAIPDAKPLPDLMLASYHEAVGWNAYREALLTRAIGNAQAEGWTKGFPTKHWADEWFIAVLKDGSRAVLRALPEEYSHDFKTADETYYTKEWVIKWMQFPDSQFITPPQPEE